MEEPHDVLWWPWHENSQVNGILQHYVVKYGLIMAFILNDLKVLHAAGLKEDPEELLALSLLSNQERVYVRPISPSFGMVFNQTLLPPFGV